MQVTVWPIMFFNNMSTVSQNLEVKGEKSSSLEFNQISTIDLLTFAPFGQLPVD